MLMSMETSQSTKTEERPGKGRGPTRPAANNKRAVCAGSSAAYGAALFSRAGSTGARAGCV